MSYNTNNPLPNKRKTSETTRNNKLYYLKTVAILIIKHIDYSLLCQKIHDFCDFILSHYFS